jgi:hypothetical protein
MFQTSGLLCESGPANPFHSDRVISEYIIQSVWMVTHPNTNHLGPEDRCGIVRGAVEGREYKVLLKLRVDVCLVNMSRVRCLFSRFRVSLEIVEERVYLDRVVNWEYKDDVDAAI